ncbi:hypothetical protein BJ912DRAFT_1052138 [Pholiota molesta]|nr:hypothetical protein BJ912DRAFT_1052138 [Pholiota molesta]
MNTQGVDEDALDSEALQAQIDLSMSFAQSLVSSWMEPHKFPTNSRKKDLEKELTDYMRRPPRLGVGASVPEGHQSTSREVARLKGKLVGSKRSRDEEETTAAKQASDEEGESRASAIKKKARPDPFDVVHGKKKKKQKVAESIPTTPILHAPATPHSTGDSPKEVEDMVLGATQSPKLNGTHTATLTPVKSKKKKKQAFQAVKDESSDATDAHVIQSLDSRIAEKSIPRDTPLSPNPKPGKGVTGEEPIDPFLATTPRSSNVLHKSLPPVLAKIPLLNLSGPPSDPESDADHAMTTSPKKKRKRRKKKKSHTGLDNPETTTSPQQTTNTQ